MKNGIVIYNRPDEAFIMKEDKNKPWPSMSDENLLKYLDRTDPIEKVRFTDEKGIGDGIKIFFKQ